MVCGCEEKLKAEITAEACWEGTGGGANVPGRQRKRMQSMYQQVLTKMLNFYEQMFQNGLKNPCSEFRLKVVDGTNKKPNK
jgi:hypothetical protein